MENYLYQHTVSMTLNSKYIKSFRMDTGDIWEHAPVTQIRYSDH